MARADDGALVVAVRMRPFNDREIERGDTKCVEMWPAEGKTQITDPRSGNLYPFTFDYSYDSFDAEGESYCTQARVWEDIGRSSLGHAMEGYNVSLFAYGQTGSGKTYSMMGYPPTPLNPNSGIIPVACSHVFDIAAQQAGTMNITLECSMMEIYMEKVRDLFNARSKKPLAVRGTVGAGFHVEKLSRVRVKSFAEVESLMESGAKARTIASTEMNRNSSRAHTIFQIFLSQTPVDPNSTVTAKSSSINLIDLAGSERQAATGTMGSHLKEASAINKSLSALGNVMSKLVEKQNQPRRKVVVPYRDSVLTKLLRNALGGNAKTALIAAISPAAANFGDTLSTLRFADRAKQIKTRATINEDPQEALMKKYQAEIIALREQLLTGSPQAGGKKRPASMKLGDATESEMIAKLQADMAAMAAEREREAAARASESAQILGSLGEEHRQREADRDKSTRLPHLRNLHHDENFDGKVLHFLDAEETTFGRKDARPLPDVTLGGLSITQRHCIVRNHRGVVKLSPCVFCFVLFLFCFASSRKMCLARRPRAPARPRRLRIHARVAHRRRRSARPRSRLIAHRLSLRRSRLIALLLLVFARLDDDAKVYVNGRPLAPGVPTTLNQADRVIIGVSFLYVPLHFTRILLTV